MLNQSEEKLRFMESFNVVFNMINGFYNQSALHQSDIQNRTDAVLSITDELDLYNELFPDPSEKEGKEIMKIKKMKCESNAYNKSCI